MSLWIVPICGIFVLQHDVSKRQGAGGKHSQSPLDPLVVTDTEFD